MEVEAVKAANAEAAVRIAELEHRVESAGARAAAAAAKQIAELEQRTEAAEVAARQREDLASRALEVGFRVARTSGKATPVAKRATIRYLGQESFLSPSACYPTFQHFARSPTADVRCEV